MPLTPDQQTALDIQNRGRQDKNLPALQWDAQLERDAQRWADALAREVGQLQHATADDRPGQGENLFWAFASPGPYPNPLSAAARSWMNEEARYDGQRIGEGRFADYGHYTQCMWKSTSKVGMAASADSRGGVYVVGRYSPPGNYTGQKPF